jgi:TolB protein
MTAHPARSSLWVRPGVAAKEAARHRAGQELVTKRAILGARAGALLFNLLVMNRFTPYACLLAAVLSSSAIHAQLPGSQIGIFDQLTDIGAPGIPGEVRYAHAAQTYKVKGSGANIWLGSDSFTFLWKEMEGDFIIQTRIQFLGEGMEAHRKTGLMIRQSTADSSAMVACTVHGDGLTSLQYRRSAGADVEEIKFETTTSDVLQLEKKGNTYTMSVAPLGEPYVRASIEDIELGEVSLTGLFVCAHTNEQAEEVVFSNTRLFQPAPADLVPYRDYLGSLLEILDVETGERIVVGSSEGSWQAPNWTPDGKTLIYNANGKLYTFDLATRRSREIDTGFAQRNNNDHVLSFDGTQLGISHHADEADGQSLIYTLPVTGGTPQRVTDQGPSYLHGWSPDGKYLIYTAEREGAFNLYRIPVTGGKETQLTHTPGLDDGSEYTPDGQHIYFNSARSGTMQIWHMNADGSNQTQLTFDSLNDWFPHVSPDQQRLVFLSFGEEVPADDHPFYQQVYLRLMPIGGGAPQVIAYLYGGQGSLNVPSWSPDGKKIAFISNGLFGE